MADGIPVTITFMSSGMTCASMLLGNNAFPEQARTLAGVVERRLAILIHNAHRVRDAVEHELLDFEWQIHNRWSEFHSLSPELNWVVVAERTESNAALQAVLFEIKAFLDLYSRLIMKLFDLAGIKGAIDDFGKGKVNGKSISGGSLINWLRNCVPTTDPYVARLADVIQRHSEEWISDAVSIRDTVGHRYEISGIKGLVVQLPMPLPQFPSTSVASPVMPTGEHLEDFAQVLIEKLFPFIDETVVLLPDVNRSHFGQVPEAIRRLPWMHHK